jgi:hypothetical protein
MRSAAGRAFLRRVPSDQLAIAGMIVLVLCVGRALPLAGEAAEWAQYLLLGATTPLAVIGLARVPAPRLTRMMAVAGALAALGYVVWSGRWVAVPAAAAQVLLAAAVRRRRPAAEELVVAIFAWAAVLTLTRNIGPQVDTLGDLVAASGPAVLAVDAAILAWVTTSVAAARRVGTTFVHRAGLVASLGLLALESFRVEYLFDLMSTHHWGAFVAPAEIVRQGGWLLWDTPATYGPGATLAIAAMPTNAWDGFFWLNVLACFASATLLLVSLRCCTDGVLALALTLCAVPVAPGGTSRYGRRRGAGHAQRRTLPVRVVPGVALHRGAAASTYGHASRHLPAVAGRLRVVVRERPLLQCRLAAGLRAARLGEATGAAARVPGRSSVARGGRGRRHVRLLRDVPRPRAGLVRIRRNGVRRE